MNKKEWIDKFPWIDGFVYEYENRIEIDECPCGWTDYIELLCGEINEIIVRDNLDFHPEQIKEKYGELRFYYSGGSEEIDRIIGDYSILLGNVCFTCGRPDSAISRGSWIECVCRECYEIYNNDSYEKHFYADEANMVETREIIKYSKGDKQHICYDVRPTAEKIRMKWKEKHND